MANPKVIMQAASFLTKMNIPYTSIKMFGKMLMINTTDLQSAKVIESILNGSGVANVNVEEPEDRYEDDYAVVGLMNEETEYSDDEEDDEDEYDDEDDEEDEEIEYSDEDDEDEGYGEYEDEESEE